MDVSAWLWAPLISYTPMVNTLSYYSSSVAALTPTMSRRGFRASVLPPLALVQSGLLLAPMVFLTIGGVDAENTHRIPKPVRHFLLKHLFLCPPLSVSLWVLLFWLRLGSSLFVVSSPLPLLLGALFYGVCQGFIIFGGFHEFMSSRSSKTPRLSKSPFDSHHVAEYLCIWLILSIYMDGFVFPPISKDIN